MANNVIDFPTKSGENELLNTKMQIAKKPERLITSDLRKQLRDECRNKHGYFKPISK